MRTSNVWRTVVLTVALWWMCGGVAAQSVLPREIRARILQAVVEVYAYDASVDRFVMGGSGTIVSPDGFVLTNFHVVGDVETGEAYEWHGIFVTDPRAPDRSPVFSYWARFVAGDPYHDLALVRIVEDADENPIAAGFVFPSMPVGEANSLIPGDPITVVGYPGISGATITFTSGIVSGFLGEDLETGGKQWIKTDAKLARGNSGGAAFDENGVLVGIPTLRVQTDDGGYIEQQDYLRPIALAWPLISTHVANVDRVGGVRDEIATITTPAPAAAVNPLAPRTAASSGFVETGVLTEGDTTLADGEYVRPIAIEAVAGEPVTLVLTSTDFDAYLLVVAPDGSVVLEVDDSEGASTNVDETFVPEETGVYTVGVTSYAAGETGAYELRVTGAAPAGAAATNAVATPESDPTAATLLVEAGSLSEGDLTLDGGEYVDVFPVTLTAGAPVTIDLASGEFDVYLVVLDPADAVALEADDSPGRGLDVMETFVPDVSGTYLLTVTSAFAGETGTYRLSVIDGAEAAPVAIDGGGGPRPDGALGSASGVVGDLAIGNQVRAELAGAPDEAAYHTYLIEVPFGTERVTVEMAADVDLDLFLKHGTEIASLGEDGDWDYRDIDTAHRAAFTINEPAAGTWYVDVVWLDGDGTGRYTLRVR